MKQAKASKRDIRCLIDFFLMLEQGIEQGTYTVEGEAEPRQISYMDLYDLSYAAWESGVGVSWRRVVMGADILIDQCCDPNLDHLEWRPDVRKFLKSQGGEDVSSQTI